MDIVVIFLYSRRLSLLIPVANGGQPASSQGSDSYSSTSSLSSGTPVSSLSGLSQVMFPPPFGLEMVDVCISTEDGSSRKPSSDRTETAIQTDPLDSDTSPTRVISIDTSRMVGETILLKDTVIRSGSFNKNREAQKRTFSAGDKETLDSPKTAVLMALSKPRKPIRRSQSHVTVSGTQTPVCWVPSVFCQNTEAFMSYTCTWATSYSLTVSCRCWGSVQHNHFYWQWQLACRGRWGIDQSCIFQLCKKC